MFSSSIEQLRQSTFQQKKQGSTRHNQKQKPNSSLRVRSPNNSFISQDTVRIEKQKLDEYCLKLPSCSYHHQPIKFLCVSSTCNCSNYAICSENDCKKLHQNPEIAMIDIATFNDLIRDNCTSLILLSENVKKYFQQLKHKIIHNLDINAQKIEYILHNIYMNEVPVLIRQKKHNQINSSKLYTFLNKDLPQNNPIQRQTIELLRNQIVLRITDIDKNINKLHNSKEYDSLLLKDLIKNTNSISNLDYISHIQVKHFQSSILQFKEEFELVCKMLKENRAPAFQKITTIFRASEHEFEADKYHQAIDGRAPTITLIRTSNNKKFGAFLNCKINQNQDWICDATGLSFIFSLDREEVYKLKSQASSRIKAAFGGREGPQIGSGCDIYIYDQCNKYRKNGANLGGSYRLPSHLQFGTSKAKSYLAGEQYFLVQDYEVFMLQ